jgi:hypothetical protein
VERKRLQRRQHAALVHKLGTPGDIVNNSIPISNTKQYKVR